MEIARIIDRANVIIVGLSKHKTLITVFVKDRTQKYGRGIFAFGNHNKRFVVGLFANDRKLIMGVQRFHSDDATVYLDQYFTITKPREFGL